MATVFDIQKAFEEMAGDNRFVYGRWNGAGNGTAANPGDGWHWDCGTAVSRCIREAKNGHKNDRTPMSWYTWPNNDDSQYFDNYLLENGFTRYNFNHPRALSSGYEVVIVVGTKHVWAYHSTSNNDQFEANDGYGGYGAKSIDIHPTIVYPDSKYMYFPTGWDKGAQIKNGLQDKPEPDGRLAYYTNGKIDTSVTTVAQNSNGWYFVKDGYVADYYWGLAKNQYGWWVCEAGKVNFNAKTGFYGLALSDTEYGWFWCEGGQLQEKKNAVLKDPYDGSWRYVKDGRWIENYNGLAANSNGVWRIVDGVVDFTPGTFTETIKTNADGMVLLDPSVQ